MPFEQAVSLVAKEFELGPRTGVTRWRSYPVMLRLGWLLVSVAVPGLIVLMGVPGILVYPATMLVVGAAMINVGTRRRKLRGWLARYGKGYAQWLPGDLEPCVVRWDSVADVAISFRTVTSSSQYGSTTKTYFSSFSVRLRTGETTREIAGTQWKIGHLAADAHRVIGPRLIASAIAAYEAGQSAVFGSVRIDQQGITWTSPAGPDLWADISSIEMRQAEVLSGTSVVTEILLRKTAGQRVEISLSGRPNGIFLPDMIAHAAARQGVPISRTMTV
jgi:hypothetical protein